MKYLIGFIIGIAISLSIQAKAMTLSAHVEPNKCNIAMEVAREICQN